MFIHLMNLFFIGRLPIPARNNKQLVHSLCFRSIKNRLNASPFPRHKSVYGNLSRSMVSPVLCPCKWPRLSVSGADISHFNVNTHFLFGRQNVLGKLSRAFISWLDEFDLINFVRHLDDLHLKLLTFSLFRSVTLLVAY